MAQTSPYTPRLGNRDGMAASRSFTMALTECSIALKLVGCAARLRWLGRAQTAPRQRLIIVHIQRNAMNPSKRALWCGCLVLAGGVALVAFKVFPGRSADKEPLQYKPRRMVDSSGFLFVLRLLRPWQPSATLEEISASWERVGHRSLDVLERQLAQGGISKMFYRVARASLLNYEGEPEKAAELLEEARTAAEADPALAEEWLYTLVFLQGVTALRRGENENCVLCRGESSCILPIAPAAVHTNPPARAWPSSISPSTWSSFPTTSRSAGC